MFVDGYVRRDIFIDHINDNGAIWNDSIFEEDIPIHFYFSKDMSTKVQMVMPTDDIPKTTALNWLRQLGLRK